MVDAGPADDALARESEGRRKVSGREGREKSGDEPYQTERKGEQGGPGEEGTREQSCSVLPPMKLLMGEEEEEEEGRKVEWTEGWRGQ